MSVTYYLLKENVPLSMKDKLSIKKVSGKSVVFVGKKAVGYAIGIGTALEFTLLSPFQLKRWPVGLEI